jgi:hypothetical protein
MNSSYSSSSLPALYPFYSTPLQYISGRYNSLATPSLHCRRHLLLFPGASRIYIREKKAVNKDWRLFKIINLN